MPRPPYTLAFVRRSASVPQDHGINAVTALHTTEDIGVVFVGVRQVIAPVMHEQARATSASSRGELFARGREVNGMSTPPLCHRSVSHCFS